MQGQTNLNDNQQFQPTNAAHYNPWWGGHMEHIGIDHGSEDVSVELIIVNHGNVFGTGNWYTFYCPECRSQVQGNDEKCEHCGNVLRRTTL